MMIPRKISQITDCQPMPFPQWSTGLVQGRGLIKADIFI